MRKTFYAPGHVGGDWNAFPRSKRNRRSVRRCGATTSRTRSFTLANCANTTLQYVLQTSTDLSNWSNVQSSFAVFSNLVVTIPTTNQQGFYQLITNPAPIFQAAFVAISNITFIGNNTVVDSFESGNPLYSTGGIYDVNKRKANGNLASGSSLSGEINVGNANIHGRVMTGPGTIQSNVSLGSQGAVGNTAWNGSQHGIERGYWSGGFAPTIPDVVPPVGGSDLPAVISNVLTLNGNYIGGQRPGHTALHHRPHHTLDPRKLLSQYCAQQQ